MPARSDAVGHRHHLRGSQHLPEALVLREVEGSLAAVIDVGNEDRAAIGESELVAAERRNSSRVRRGGMVEVVARVEGGVAHEFEERAVKSAGAGAGNDVGESRRAAADLSRHPAGTRLNALHRIDIEIGECGAAHLRIADIGAVHGEGRFHPALSVDGKLGGEVGRAVGVGHGAGSQQQQLAEVALVQREFAHRLAGKRLAAGAGSLARRR